MSYLTFVPAGFSPSGKTKNWSVQDSTHSHLARISWYAPSRKYAVVFNPAATFDPGCLREIADYAEDATRLHKA